MSHFGSTFSTAALLGFGGGEDNLAALKAAHVDGGRRFIDAFNSPGSYATGRAFVSLSESQGWDGLHQGVSANPDALTASYPPSTGPKFTAAFSGTTLATTGVIAKLLVKLSMQKQVTVVGGRVSTPIAVTIVNLEDAPAPEMHPRARLSAPVLIPILVSSAAAAGCGLIEDLTTLAMIVLGMVCSGASSYFLRAGDLTFTRPSTAVGAPAGDGYLDAGDELVVLKGSESAVSAVTRGQFSLRYKSEGTYSALSICGRLLIGQCLIQLLIVPQGTVLGQMLFLISMIVACLYNAYVARQGKAAWQRMVLEDVLKAPSIERYSLGTRTATAVFLMQVLKPTNIEEQLSNLLPNNTPTWSHWRQTVARRLRDEKPSFQDTDLGQFSDSERKLLQTLYSDAQDAVEAFSKLNNKI